MSFTNKIKNEILELTESKSEDLAFLSGFVRNNCYYDEKIISLTTENNQMVNKLIRLFNDIYDVEVELTMKVNVNFNKNVLHGLIISDKVNFILNDLNVVDEKFKYMDRPGDYIVDNIDDVKAYLRGVFLSCGSVNDPKTSRYHMELLIDKPDEAVFVQKLVNTFDLNAKLLTRDKGYMVYLKEAEKISDFLKVIQAYQAVMYYEDIRIYRDSKNMTNRLNNCEQANIDKIIETANTQIKDINFIKEQIGFNVFDDKTNEVVQYRLKYPEASLQELSKIISLETGKTLTKSGLNHRFRKLKELADRLRGNDEK